MTVPHLMNCPHRDDGWCLDCVVELGKENWRLRDIARDAADASTKHQAEVLRLRAALENVLPDTPEEAYAECRKDEREQCIAACMAVMNAYGGDPAGRLLSSERVREK